MDALDVLAVFGAVSIGSTALAFLAPLWSRAARRRRLARKTPVRPVRDGRRDELIRIRGVIRCVVTPLPVPFADQAGVFHWTQLTDMSNPGETVNFVRTAQCEFLVDDGTGQARVPREAALEVLAPETGGGIDRNDRAVAAFLGRQKAQLFSKAGAVVWRQRSLAVGDEVLAWGRVVIEPDSDVSHHPGLLRDAPERVVLAPPDARGAVVIERTPNVR